MSFTIFRDSQVVGTVETLGALRTLVQRGSVSEDWYAAGPGDQIAQKVSVVLSRPALSPWKKFQAGAAMVWSWIVVLSFLTGIGFFVIQISDGFRSKARSKASSEARADFEATKYRAYSTAKAIVRQNLKAPASATFGSLGEAGCRVSSPRTDRYACSGWVEASNSFGAKLRKSWSVELRESGNDFVVEDVTID